MTSGQDASEFLDTLGLVKSYFSSFFGEKKIKKIEKCHRLLADDTFDAGLEVIPSEDWCRTWSADRTIMLRRTSKRVNAVVDKMRLPVVVHLSESFWYDS
jgi:hypothetical protein